MPVRLLLFEAVVNCGMTHLREILALPSESPVNPSRHPATVMRSLRRVLGAPALVVGLALTVLACDSESTPSGPDQPPAIGGSPDHGSVLALVDSVMYTGTITTATKTRDTFIIQSTSDDGDGVSINFSTKPAVGTYNVSSSNDVQLQVVVTDNRTSTTWIASRENGGSGLLNIQSIDSNVATGTFNFIAPPAPGTRGVTVSKVVSDGRFSATF